MLTTEATIAIIITLIVGLALAIIVIKLSPKIDKLSTDMKARPVDDLPNTYCKYPGLKEQQDTQEYRDFMDNTIIQILRED